LQVAWDTLLLSCPVAAGRGLTPELPRRKKRPDKSNGCLRNCAVFIHVLSVTVAVFTLRMSSSHSNCTGFDFAE
jgi:hypothetical protein